VRVWLNCREAAWLLILLLVVMQSASANDYPVGYELLDGNKVLRLYNDYYSYYFNTSSMIQLTNHYDEYWTKNNLCLAYETSSWEYFCKDSLNMDWSIDTDNMTFVWVQGLKNITKGSKKAEFNITYYLGVDDEELTVVVGVENVGQVDINNRLKFVWIIEDIQIGADVENDVIQAWLNETWMVERLLNETINYTADYVYDQQFELRDILSDDYLRLRWQYSDYTVNVESSPPQHNAPVRLMLNYDGGIGVGESKKTKFFWVDAIPCYATFGDRYSPAGNYPSYSQFSDGNDSWGMTCHIRPDSTACPTVVTPTSCAAGGEVVRCRIQKRYTGVATWLTVASSSSNVNYGTDDVTIGLFANYPIATMAASQDLRHNHKTDYRCQIVYEWFDDTPGEMACVYDNYDIQRIDDYWYNNHTPESQNIMLNSTSISDNDDLKCLYDYYDNDTDPENVSLVEYEWFKGGVKQPDLSNLSNISHTNTSACDSWSCGVKVFDDVFKTSKEGFNQSSPISVLGCPVPSVGKISTVCAIFDKFWCWDTDDWWWLE